MCMQDHIEGITDLLDIRITHHTDIIQDVLMPTLAGFTETIINTEETTSIEMTEGFLYVTIITEERIMVETMPSYPKILLEEEMQR